MPAFSCIDSCAAPVQSCRLDAGTETSEFCEDLALSACRPSSQPLSQAADHLPTPGTRRLRDPAVACDTKFLLSERVWQATLVGSSCLGELAMQFGRDTSVRGASSHAVLVLNLSWEQQPWMRASNTWKGECFVL